VRVTTINPICKIRGTYLPLAAVEHSGEPSLLERLVHHVGRRRVEIGFDRRERLPAPDLHHHARVDLLVDEESLGEPASEIVAADIPEVVVARLRGRALGRPLDDIADAALGQLHERRTSIDVFGVLKTVEIALDIGRQVGIARLPGAVRRVFSAGDAESVVVAVVGPLDVFRTDLRNLERPQPDAAAEADDDVVALTRGDALQVLELGVSHPDFVLILGAGRFEPHVGLL